MEWMANGLRLEIGHVPNIQPLTSLRANRDIDAIAFGRMRGQTAASDSYVLVNNGTKQPGVPLPSIRRQLAATGRGKHVGRFSYYHTSLAAQVPGVMQQLVSHVRKVHDRPFPCNVIKLNDRSRISFLRYDSFDAAFPVLLAALSCDLETGTARLTSYQGSHNPPILHRKELLLPANDPRVCAGSRLTEWLERHGAFRQTATIGTREGWRRRLLEIGIGFPERPP